MLRKLSYMSRIVKIKGGRKGSAAAKENRLPERIRKHEYA